METCRRKRKIVLATVKGDIHDIGKNIVKVLLENYSFEVVDLGKDVPPETIVDTVVAQQIRLVGLSALMTTTVVSMEETIRQLREKAPWCKVMVGGAVLNQEYADMIGADFMERCNAVRVLRTRTAAAIKVTDKGGNQNVQYERPGYPGESNSQTCVQGSGKAWI